MDKQITHKQHYVWREYLRPWGHLEGKKIFVWWNNKKVSRYTDLFDILREKDFYQFKPLNTLELFCLKRMFGKTKYTAVKKANETLNNFVNTITMIDLVIEEKNDFLDNLIQAGEDIQSSIERCGIKPLKLLKQEDLTLFNYEEDGIMIDFLMFILFQFFRTKGNKEKATDAVRPNDECLKMLFKKEMNDYSDYSIDWNNLYNYAIHYIVNQVSYSMSIRGAHIRLMKSINAKFIVSDQPVYNVSENVASDFDLFYPISPKLAIIISCKYKDNAIVTISDQDVMNYNFKTLKHAHNFIIGPDKTYVDLKWDNI